MRGFCCWGLVSCGFMCGTSWNSMLNNWCNIWGGIVKDPKQLFMMYKKSHWISPPLPVTPPALSSILDWINAQEWARWWFTTRRWLGCCVEAVTQAWKQTIKDTVTRLTALRDTQNKLLLTPAEAQWDRRWTIQALEFETALTVCDFKGSSCRFVSRLMIKSDAAQQAVSLLFIDKQKQAHYSNKFAGYI